MMPLKTCCLCCKLETGAYVLAGFGLVACFLNLLMALFVLSGDLQVPLPESAAIFQIVWSIIVIVVYILLIVGTKKRNSCLILPFLIVIAIGLLINFIGYILFIVKLPSLEGEALIFSICIPIAIGLGIYIWMCMYSLYIKMKNHTYYNKNEYV